MIRIRINCILLVFFAAFSMIQAQDSGEPMVNPDRPGGTVGPAKLDKGVLNFEFGANLNSYNKDNFSINGQNYAGILRYGLLENLEVNLGFDYARFSGDGFKSISGLAGLTSGVKIGIAEENGAFPQIEFESKIAFPWFGKKELRPEDAEPSMNFNFANNISDEWVINYAIGMFWEGGEEAGLYGFMLMHNFNPKLTAFVEHYGNVRGDVNLEPHLGAGLMYLINNKTQIDVSLDIGRDDGARLTFIDFGIATMLISE